MSGTMRNRQQSAWNTVSPWRHENISEEIYNSNFPPLQAVSALRLSRTDSRRNWMPAVENVPVVENVLAVENGQTNNADSNTLTSSGSRLPAWRHGQNSRVPISTTNSQLDEYNKYFPPLHASSSSSVSTSSASSISSRASWKRQKWHKTKILELKYAPVKGDQINESDTESNPTCPYHLCTKPKCNGLKVCRSQGVVHMKKFHPICGRTNDKSTISKEKCDKWTYREETKKKRYFESIQIRKKK